MVNKKLLGLFPWKLLGHNKGILLLPLTEHSQCKENKQFWGSLLAQFFFLSVLLYGREGNMVWNKIQITQSMACMNCWISIANTGDYCIRWCSFLLLPRKVKPHSQEGYKYKRTTCYNLKLQFKNHKKKSLMSLGKLEKYTSSTLGF